MGTMNFEDEGDVRLVQTAVGPLWVDGRDRSLGKTIIKRREYEPEWTSWAGGAVKSGMHVVDIGSNIGYYTLLFARCVGDQGRVIAFEPDPFNRKLLERSLMEGGMSDRVTVTGAAVGDHVGVCRLHRDANHRGLHSLSPQNLIAGDEAADIDVPLVTLDAVCGSPGGCAPPDFIKIDAQGAEGAILRGGTKTLGEARHMTLMIELWPFGLLNCGSSLEEVLECLRQYGFAAFRVRKDDSSAVPCSFEEISRRAARLQGDHASLNLAFTK